MLTVTVAFEVSGYSSTLRPLSRRYSVIPSTDVTFTGGLAWAVAATSRAGRARARRFMSNPPGRVGGAILDRPAACGNWTLVRAAASRVLSSAAIKLAPGILAAIFPVL